MSASKQKQARTDSVSKRDKAQQEAAQKRRSFNIKAIIVVVVFIVVVALAFFINSSYLATHTTAVTVGTTDYSAAEFEYFYRSSYNQFYNTYSGYISYLIDNNVPLDEQQYSETETWADFFKSGALSDMTLVTALYDQAVADGHTLSDEGRQTIEQSISSADAVAAANGLKDANAYLSTAYGSGMNLDIYRDMFARYLTATEYHDWKAASYTYTDDAKAAHYSEIAADYDVIVYDSYYFSASSSSYADLDETAALAAAAADAEAVITGVKTSEEFLRNVQAFFPEANNTTGATSIANLTVNTKDWLSDPARKAGDSTVVTTDNGAYAIMFVERDTNQYNTVDVLQVFVAAGTDESGYTTEEAIAQAKADADAALAELGSDFDEEVFAAMVNIKTNSTDGGRYEAVAKHMMGDEFDAFAFSGDRKAGDTAVVFNPGSYYTNYVPGYYVVYFLGEGELYSNALAEADMRSNDIDAWIEQITAGYEAVEKSGMRYANLK